MGRLTRKEELNVEIRRKLAKKIGVSDLRLSQVLKGTGNFSINNAKKLTKAFGKDAMNGEQWYVFVEYNTSLRGVIWRRYLKGVKS